MGIYSEFSHWKWWFSIVMLVYQRVFRGVYPIISACLMVKYVKLPWKSPLIPIHLHVRPANFGVPHFRTKPLIVRYCWLVGSIISTLYHHVSTCWILNMVNHPVFMFSITLLHQKISSWYPKKFIPSPTKPSSNLIQSIKIPLIHKDLKVSIRIQSRLKMHPVGESLTLQGKPLRESFCRGIPWFCMVLYGFVMFCHVFWPEIWWTIFPLKLIFGLF